MKKLSIGLDSTLGNYRDLCCSFFGEKSLQTVFIDEKIKDARDGRDEEVIADESQMMFLLVSLK